MRLPQREASPGVRFPSIGNQSRMMNDLLFGDVSVDGKSTMRSDRMNKPLFPYEKFFSLWEKYFTQLTENIEKSYLDYIRPGSDVKEKVIPVTINTMIRIHLFKICLPVTLKISPGGININTPNPGKPEHFVN